MQHWTLKAVTLPVDYKMEFTGQELKRKESMSNLSFALLLSLILVFMVLAAQFESIIQPFVIMLTIPLAGVRYYPYLFPAWQNAEYDGIYRNNNAGRYCSKQCNPAY